MYVYIYSISAASHRAPAISWASRKIGVGLPLLYYTIIEYSMISYHIIY